MSTLITNNQIALLEITRKGLLINPNSIASKALEDLIEFGTSQRVVTEKSISVWQSRLADQSYEEIESALYRAEWNATDLFLIHPISLYEESIYCFVLRLPPIKCTEPWIHDIVENGPFTAFAKDTSGRFVYGNSRLKSYYGNKNLLGKMDIDLAVNGDEARSFQEDDNIVIENSTYKEVPHEQLTPAGASAPLDIRTWKWYCTEYQIPGHLLGVSLDISNYIKERNFIPELISGGFDTGFGDIALKICKYLATHIQFNNLIDSVTIVQNDYVDGKHLVIATESCQESQSSTSVNNIRIGDEWEIGDENSLWSRVNTSSGTFFCHDLSSEKA